MSAAGVANILLWAILIIVIAIVLIVVLKLLIGVLFIIPAIQVSATSTAYTETVGLVFSSARGLVPSSLTPILTSHLLNF